MIVTFPVSVEFMTPVAFGGIIILLPKYDITIYVSFIGFTFASVPSPNENRRPKRAFETLLVVAVVLLTASCSSPPTDVVVVVVVLPVVEADTRVVVVVDAKIIVSVKIVATRWMLRSRAIFLSRLFSVSILSTFYDRSKG